MIIDTITECLKEKLNDFIILYKEEFKTDNHSFKIEGDENIKFLIFSDTYIDDHKEEEIINYLNKIDIFSLLKNPTVGSIFITNQGYEINKKNEN